jgi:hypothetical protein
VLIRKALRERFPEVDRARPKLRQLYGWRAASATHELQQRLMAHPDADRGSASASGCSPTPKSTCC